MPAQTVEKRTPEGKAPDFGATLAKRRSQDFKSKIQGWNDHGDISQQTQDEVVVITENAKSEGHHDSKRQTKSFNPDDGDGVTNALSAPIATAISSRLTSREVDLGRRAWVRRKSKPQVEVAEEIKQATSPKKRVVSDGHWRRDRLAKLESEKAKTTEQQSSPALSVFQQAKLNDPPKISVAVQQWVETTPGRYKLSTPKRLDERPRSRSPGRSSPNYESDCVKIYISRRKASRNAEKNNNDRLELATSESRSTSDSTTERPSSATGATTPNGSPAKAHYLRTTPRDQISRRSPVSDTDAQRSSERRRRSRTTGDERETPPSQAAITGPPVFRNRIEGWLAETANNSPTTLTGSRSKDGLNGVVASIAAPDKEHAATLSTSSTTTLQRRGARKTSHSPIKQGIDDRFRPRTTQTSSRTIPGKMDLERARPASSGASEVMRPGYYEDSLLSRLSDGDEPRRQHSHKRKLAKHSDLISVLSAEDRGIRSARSVRTRRTKPAGDIAADVMNQITIDELKYLRELRTLIDGVIPVLLTHVLQKNDPSGSKRLFSGSSKMGQALTQPIVEMGVALERLKSLQRRMPLHEPDDFVTWAAGAAKAYADYIRAWRLGFNDLVVKLAPAEDADLPKPPGSWESSLRGLGKSDKEGGESANVAYLLKRPLVRLKHLAKALETLEHVRSSKATSDTAALYSKLLKDARQKANDERARLEDETAASIDPSRARDPHSLLAVTGVRIDRSRSVRARDFFDLELTHSSGQQIGCKIEIIARDNTPGHGTLGDILFCEVSLAGRWLLFPPISSQNISARQGEKDGELVIMLRGLLPTRKEWREVMSLVTDDPIVVQEWVEILGSSPMPSRLTKKSSFNTGSRGIPPHRALKAPAASLYTESVLSSIVDADVPLGEPTMPNGSVWEGSELDDSTTVTYESRSPLQRSRARRHRRTLSVDSYEQIHDQINSRRFNEQPRDQDSDLSSSVTHSSYDTFSDHRRPRSGASTPKQEYKVWLPSEDEFSDLSRDYAENDVDDATGRPVEKTLPLRPSMHRRTSSVPSAELPSIPKLRKAGSPEQETPRASRSRHQDGQPALTPASMSAPKNRGQPSPPDSHHKSTTRASTTPNALQTSTPPSFTPTFLKKHRRTSSPLKHEYEPSTASEPLSESDLDSDEDDIYSVTSESSADSDGEGVSIVGDLKGFQKFLTRPAHPAPSPKSPLAPIEEASLGPSDSASQAPYRSTPVGAGRAESTMAGLFSWSESGAWTSLHPEECSIFVGPGLIEAFDVTQAQEAMASQVEGIYSPSQCGVKPLIALELTPLVPLRRGTAVDLSVRSPPTNSSLLRAGSNIMFRSRTPEECERLYALVNRARIDNPTFIALQNARGPIKTSNWAAVMDRQNAARSSAGSSWWPASLSRKGSTYRSKGSRATSTAATESSVGTLNSAFSALRRFSGGGKMFDIARSTLMSREGTRSSTNSDSLSSGIATPTLSFDTRLGTPMGVTNTKIRLYVRESASKWRDLGAARLTILIPPRDEPAIVNNPRATGLEKRVMIRGASKGETLLDALLPETSFERVARTGIAVSVWRETAEPSAMGGVGSATLRVYMVQMKSERDAAFTFGLVGKLRY